MHTLWFNLAFKDSLELNDVLTELDKNEFLMSTEKLSSNKVFSFGRDHGYHGRLLSHGIIAIDSLHVKDNNLTGYCFTPQDGNSILSSIAATVRFLNPHSYQDKINSLGGFFFDRV